MVLRSSSEIRGPIYTLLDHVDPYLLNPFKLLVARARGRFTHRVEGSEATFESPGFWETASLLHTFRKERSILEDLMSMLEPTDTFYDIGANLGAFTCFADSIITDGVVVAVEAHPENVRHLERNVALNCGDAQIFEYAISDNRGSARLSNGRSRAGNQRHALTSAPGIESTISVDTITGDGLIAEAGLPQPTVVKIDVEGAEVRVLEGFESALRSPECRAVYCEVHPDMVTDFGAEQGAAEALINGAGFTTETLQATGGQYYVKGTR